MSQDLIHQSNSKDVSTCCQTTRLMMLMIAMMIWWSNSMSMVNNVTIPNRSALLLQYKNLITWSFIVINHTMICHDSIELYYVEHISHMYTIYLMFSLELRKRMIVHPLSSWKIIWVGLLGSNHSSTTSPIILKAWIKRPASTASDSKWTKRGYLGCITRSTRTPVKYSREYRPKQISLICWGREKDSLFSRAFLQVYKSLFL